MRGGDPFADFEGRDLRTAIRLEMTLRAEGKSVGNYALWPALDRAAEDTLNAAPYMLEDQLYGLGLIPHVELEVRWLDSERVVVVWKKPARAGGHNGRVSLFQRSRGWWRWVARKDAALGNGEMTVRWSDYDTRLAIVENSRDGECATTTLVVDGGSLRELPGPVCSMECPMPEEAAEPAAL